MAGRLALNRDLTRRTPGEELWCRRRRAGLTAAEAAALLRVGRTTLFLAEGDRRPLPACLDGGFAPHLPELLALARRRAGLTLDEAAMMAGCSRVTLLKREREADPSLRRRWERRGFTFVQRRG
jgi:DNA-binding XRE family transcriptional regulator